VKRLYISSGSILTGDVLADAIVDLGEAAARHNSSAKVDIPVVLDSGETGRARMLIGPASEILAVPEAAMHPVEAMWDDVAAHAAITRIRELTLSLGRTSTAQPVFDTDRTAYIPDFGGL
jgi:hypothetical protein